MKYVACLVFVLYLLLAVAPTKLSAFSNDVIIYQVQTGSALSASQELVLLLNSSIAPVKVSDWCLFYSSASNATVRTLSCIDANLQTEIWLEPGGITSFASGEFVIANPGFVPDFTFTSGLSATGGHVWIENATDATVDRLGWGSASLAEGTPAPAHTSGKVLSRNTTGTIVDTDNNINDFSSQLLITSIVSGLYEVEIEIDLCLNLVDLQTSLPAGYLSDELDNCYLDVCTNLDELQKEVPLGYEISNGNCAEILKENSTLLITEILPNASSSDQGKEFIEIYNPNSWSVKLEGYVLELGPSFTKRFILPSGQISPGQYIIFSDNDSNLVLPNTNGVQVRLVTPAGNVVSETPVYINADDDMAWVFIDDKWIYTNQPSPNSANQPYLEPAEDEEINVTTVLAPCPVGKYRNPETNRCRNIETAVSSLTPCDEDEFRNLDTNRCRKVAGASTLAPCDEGQERNPETNRCRKISTLASTDTALASVEDIQVESTPGQINWLVILIALSGTFGYIIYEWRNEIRQKYNQIRY